MKPHLSLALILFLACAATLSSAEVITNQDVNHHRYEVAMTEGDRLADLENWDGALERYEAALAVSGYGEDAAALAAVRLAREKIGNQVARKREAAIAAFNRDDYDTAFDIFFELYDQDDPEVYAYLGRCFEEGLGTGKDYEEALYWAGLAAERNNPIGLNTLGVCYDHGRGVERDRAEAMRYFKLAADQGYPTAMVNLGLHYENGYATAVNLSEAARLYRLAAETGLYKGQFHYARCP